MNLRKPYWQNKPTPDVISRMKLLKSFTSVVRTVRKLTYLLYPKAKGKILGNAYTNTIKDVVRCRTNFFNIGGIQIDWNKIKESRVISNFPIGWDNIEEIISYRTRDISDGYTRNKTPSHKKHIECWFEKETVIDEFEEVCKKYDVGYVAVRGQVTWTAKKKASERLDRNSLVLYFGDNDYKGKEILEVIKRDMKYLGCKAEFKWVGVTEEQEDRFNTPRNSRLDGFELEELKKIIEEIIRKFINIKQYNEILSQEQKDIKKLKTMTLKVI